MVARTVAILIIGAIIVGGGLATVGYVYFGRGPPSPNLPQGCVRPAGGFLIVAGFNGFNDSVDHGVPSNPWPIIDVHQGANVTIVVCNADTQPHGFQVTHYYDGNIVTLAPGQVLKVSFVADQAGRFQIYCSILCTVHWAMLGGQLNVG